MFPMFSQEEGILSIGDFLKKILSLPFEEKIIRNNKKIEYYNIPAAFDIEVSSFYEGDKIAENKRAIMYIWQFGIHNYVTAGRTWNEFITFLSLLSKILKLGEKRKLVVYVHNLPYEFQFARKWLEWEKVFLLSERKPVYAKTTNGIEFRCSLKLSGGKSLDNVSKDLMKYKVKKMIGFLDYNKIRTPLTPLTDKELKYCEYDIRVITSYIQEKIEQDGDITKIPLTNTGYVRQYCREQCYKRWKSYRQIIGNLTIEPDEYSQLKRAFQGGFTHANAKYVRKTLFDVGSHDFGSSYPGVMVMEKFPMSKSTLIEKELSSQELKYYLIRYCCLFDIEFFDIEPKRYQEHPISSYKCWICENAVIDNGRIVMAKHIATTITEQDFFTYCEFYTFSKINIKNFRIYEKNYLPRQFVLSILDLYEKKTSLKGIEEEALNYMISKNMINASFGMCVTDPVRDENLYEHGLFIKNRADIINSIDRYNKNIRRFLYYPWGVWITAYARANLFSGIIELGDDYIYSDTDSLKSLNSNIHNSYFERYNNQVLEKIRKASEHHKIDIKRFSPKTKKGKEKTIGLWEDEGEYVSFKTLGAKRYVTSKFETQEFEDNGLLVQLTEKRFVATIAGSNKKKTMGYLLNTGKPFENFDDNLRIPPKSSGRLTLTYIDEETEGDVIDMYGVPYHYHELSSIHMEQSEYHLTMAKEFTDYLKGVIDFGE